MQSVRSLQRISVVLVLREAGTSTTKEHYQVFHAQRTDGMRDDMAKQEICAYTDSSNFRNYYKHLGLCGRGRETERKTNKNRDKEIGKEGTKQRKRDKTKEETN